MLLYLIKFSACLLVFMFFYKAFLERASMHVFKRFYLISMVIASLTIPLISWKVYTDPVLAVNDFYAEIPKDTTAGPSSIKTHGNNYWFSILWSIYGIGFLVSALRFGYNLKTILNRIQRNEKEKTKDFVHVLIENLKLPHTFFSYIFLDKHHYKTHQIPKEVFIHEHAHAKQRHSMDILVIELFQIVFWFNPLIYFIKKDIKLNHEFLADQSVIKQGIEASNYQTLLLEFSSYQNNDLLASAFNYSSIKKRFTVMNTHTSKSAVWLRSFVLLPMVAFMVYGFSEKKEVERSVTSMEKTTPESSLELDKAEENYLELEVNEKGLLFFKSKQIQIEEISRLVEMENGLQIKLIYKAYLTREKSNAITKEIKHYLTSQKVLNFGICSSFTEIDKEPGIKSKLQEGATKEQLAEYNNLAKYYNNLPEESPIVKLDDLKRIKYLYSIMTEEQRKHSEPLPNLKFPPPPPPPSKDLSDEEMKAYKEMKSRANAGKSYSWEYTNEEGKKITVIANHTMDNIPPPPPPAAPKATKAAKSAYEFVKNLKGQDILYFYNNKEVTYETILKIVQKEPNIEMTTNIKNKKGTVHFSSKQ